MNSAKRGKTCKQCQARENMQTVPSAGKHANSAKRGKTCQQCQARENMQTVSSAGNHLRFKGAYHLAKKSGNFDLKSNGTVPLEVLHNFRMEFPSEISLPFKEISVSSPF